MYQPTDIITKEELSNPNSRLNEVLSQHEDMIATLDRGGYKIKRNECSSV